MSIDIEALAVAFLQAQTAVVNIVGDRVYTDIPNAPVYPLVLVSRVGGGFVYRNHLENAELELQAHGGTHKTAYTLANICMNTMTDQMVGLHPEGVVTKVKVSTVAYASEPDSVDPSGHARPRYVCSVVVTAHP